MDKNTEKIIKAVLNGTKSELAASIQLGKTIKTVKRKMIRYQEFGIDGIIHGNSGKTPVNALNHEQIFALYKNKYFDFNITHFCEKLSENEGIKVSEATVRNIFKENDVVSIKAKKKTKANLKKKLKKQKRLSTSQKDQLIQLETEAFTGSCHPTQPRCKYLGEELQMDACLHHWFGNTKTQLHLAIDDATGLIVGGHFEEQETLKGYYTVLKQILTDYGIPILFKTDRRTVFEYKKKNTTDVAQDTMTQFSHACNTLGIDIKTSSVPQFKPRIKRSFQTLQGRLPQEFRLAGVSTLDEANAFLKSYISKFNQQFAITDNITSAFSPSPTSEQIDNTLVTFAKRTVDCGNAIRIDNKYFATFDDKAKQVLLRPKTKVSVITLMDNSKYVLYADKLLALTQIPKRQKYSKEVDFDIPEKKKPKEKYIPSAYHPWRVSNQIFFKNLSNFY